MKTELKNKIMYECSCRKLKLTVNTYFSINNNNHVNNTECKIVMYIYQNADDIKKVIDICEMYPYFEICKSIMKIIKEDKQ